jgi:8-oxo-dGTP diphosphatase
MPAPRTPGLKKPPESEQEAFLDSYDPAAFERPSVTVDVVLLSPIEDHLHTLLIRRPEQPFKGLWSLPGGFVRMDESLDAAAGRVLHAKTGLEKVFLEQLYTFGCPQRDPRTRVISVAYYALVDPKRFSDINLPGEDTLLARIIRPRTGSSHPALSCKGPDDKSVELAFDHAEILAASVQRLGGKIDYTPIGFELLPEAFTLFQLQKVHETVLGRKLNKDSFRRRMLAGGQLEATGEVQQDVDHRPATLYRFLART